MAIATDVLKWISAIVDDVEHHETPDEGTAEKMHKWMKDGVVLCTLINKVYPGSVKNIATSKMAFKQVIITHYYYGWAIQMV